jgi:hypothetical protein
MGTALASATDPDNKPHLPATWGQEFRRLGTLPIEYDPLAYRQPYGYQILGGLLRYGDYDPRFINPLAEDILRLHKEDPHRFMENRPYAPNDPDYGFNPSGRTGAGYDPLTSVLEGLGHSPEAAKEFFADGKHLAELTSNDFEWAPDTLDRGSEATHEGGPDALGHALESATTGHPWDDARPGLNRDAGTAAIMKKVIDLYSPTSDIKPPDSIIDSLGRMGAAYIDDLNFSTFNFGSSGEDLGWRALFPHGSDGHSRTNFGETAVKNFMSVVAGDSDGYKSLSAAQQVFQASALSALEDDRGSGIAFAHNATKVHGILDGARSLTIYQECNEKIEETNKELEKEVAWRQFGVSSGVSLAVEAGSALVAGPAIGRVVSIAVPLALETVGEAINTAYGNHMIDYLKENEAQLGAEYLKQAQDLERYGEAEAIAAARTYANATGMTLEEKRSLVRELEVSHMVGKGKLNATARVG